MLWHVVQRNTNSKVRLTVALVGLVIGIASGFGLPVAAVDTEIGAKVCGSTPGAATVQITQPNDDSVVSQASVTVRGTVTSTSQLIIDVDGAYNNTLALASNQTAFATDVNLTKGTHTITVTANEVCGGADGVDSIVVTYQPAAQPSSGNVTPTSIEPTEDQTGVVIADSSATPEQPAKMIEQIPVIGAAVGFVSDFASNIGLSSTVISGNAPIATGAARVGLTVAAVTSVVMASSLAPVAVHSVPGVSHYFTLSSHRSMMYLEWVIRGAGVLAMSLAYFL